MKDEHGTVYIVTESEMRLTNTSAPSGTTENVVRVEGVYLVNNGNVADVLTQMARWYFGREEVQLDVINNATYAPGDRLTVYTAENAIREGLCTGADFSFGVQARSQLVLTATEEKGACLLYIEYRHGDFILNSNGMYLPRGYAYIIPNPYFDQMFNSHRILYRPLSPAAEGVMDQSEVDEVEQYEPALDLDMVTDVLEIISVDALSAEDGVVTIG